MCGRARVASLIDCVPLASLSPTLERQKRSLLGISKSHSPTPSNPPSHSTAKVKRQVNTNKHERTFQRRAAAPAGCHHRLESSDQSKQWKSPPPSLQAPTPLNPGPPTHSLSPFLLSNRPTTTRTKSTSASVLTVTGTGSPTSSMSSRPLKPGSSPTLPISKFPFPPSVSF